MYYKKIKIRYIVLGVTILAVFIIHRNFVHSQSTPAVFFENASSSNSETQTTASIKVKLSASSSQIAKVDYQTSGGTAYYLSEGTGKDYEFAKNTLTFNPGETEKTINITIINDTINETDETFNLTLSNPQNAHLGINTNHSYTILDDDRAALISVKDSPYNAKGDGITDDTAAIQAACDAAYTAGGGSTGKGAVVVFPEGTYIAKSVRIRDNVTYEGYGATLKVPPMSGNWVSSMVTPFNGTYGYYGYNNTVDSKPLIIRGLTIDGNSQEQGPYTSYELEHNASISISAKSTSQGRLRVYIEDCYLKDNTADGISSYINTDVTVYNVIGHNLWRGAIQFGSDKWRNYRLKVRNFTTIGDRDKTGVHSEPLSDHPEIAPSQISFEDMNLLKGGYITYSAEKGNTVNIKKVFSNYPFSFSGQGKISLTDSKIIVGKSSHTNILATEDFTADNTEFLYSEQNEATEADRTFNIYYAPYCQWIGGKCFKNLENKSAIFNNCRFKTDDTIDDSDLVYGINTSTNDLEANNSVTINGGYAQGKIDNFFSTSTSFSGITWNLNNFNLKNGSVFRCNGGTVNYDIAVWVPKADVTNIFGADNSWEQFFSNPTSDEIFFQEDLINLVNSSTIASNLKTSLINLYQTRLAESDWNYEKAFCRVNQQGNIYKDAYGTILLNKNTTVPATIRNTTTGLKENITVPNENTYSNQKTQLDESANKIATGTGSTAGVEGNTYQGNRLILGANPPTSTTNCLINDIYRLKTPISGQTHEWKCTDPGYGTNPATWEAQSTVNPIAYISDYPQDVIEDSSLALTPQGTNVTSYKYKLDEGSWSNETPIASKINLSNLSNDSHTISIIGKNSSGAWQDQSRATTYYFLSQKDSDPPAGIARINEGYNFTDNNQVTLTMETTDAHDVTEMKISNVNNFQNAQTYPYSHTKDWTLDNTKGNQLVYVWFKDEKGNWTPDPAIDQIYLTKEGYTAADINQDTQVNQADFDILKSDFLKLTANLGNPRSDINQDGQCTVKDLGILMSGWGK
ncbi:MAG: Calx-beta domain-containing protein [Candidatus Moranbacteria bacterium]|nr:Calx-beta domain-containing protein [Candidatus Moranbacteria bacterium]